MGFVSRRACNRSCRTVRSSFCPHQLSLNVPEDFLQVPRLIPAIDVAESALNSHKLPDLVGIAELPFAAALTSSTSVRHGPKQELIPLLVNSPLTVLFLFCSLCSRNVWRHCHGPHCNAGQPPRGRPTGHCRQVCCRPQRDVMKAPKKRIVLIGHLQDQLNALSAPRRATR
jgi:hypothetical protein